MVATPAFKVHGQPDMVPSLVTTTTVVGTWSMGAAASRAGATIHLVQRDTVPGCQQLAGEHNSEASHLAFE